MSVSVGPIREARKLDALVLQKCVKRFISSNVHAGEMKRKSSNRAKSKTPYGKIVEG